MKPMSDGFQTGLMRCSRELPKSLQSGTVGMLLNQASVDDRFHLACDVLSKQLGSRLTKLFSPQHGLWCEEQANMIESADNVYDRLGLPVFSLYSETRRPTAEMLSDLDCFVIDLQDVGTRVYTFIWTMLECLHACAEAGISVVILDRPNPLGGLVFEGPILDAELKSFVGNAEIPMRHGLTIGELASLFVTELTIDVELHVVSMSQWPRDALGIPSPANWVPPSPNMPRLETAVVYPGQVMLEGTNLSEGRGTTTPFEVVGAPFLSGQDLEAALSRFRLPGVQLRATRFRPTFDKWTGQVCEGIRIQVTDPRAVRSFELTIRLLQVIRQLAGDQLEWLPPPYEYEYVRPPIDILYGSARLREALDGESSVPVDRLIACDDAWRERIDGCLLYDADREHSGS